MNNPGKQITELLNETSQAHHQAFLDSDGTDPEWPIWYADYLYEKLAPLMRGAITKSELIYLLVYLDKEVTSEKPKTSWSNYYGDFLATYNG